jgi:rhodanese-related sulfurtransferase
MTTTQPVPVRLASHELHSRLSDGRLSVIDVREPMEYAGGHIPGSRNIPLSRLGSAALPDGPLVLVCQSGKRSSRGLAELLRRGHPHPLTELEGGLGAWQEAGLALQRQARAPLPLMRQVQTIAGVMVLLGVVLSQTLAPGWIWLSGFVGAGLTVAGISGFCGMARLLAVMPWNRVKS